MPSVREKIGSALRRFQDKILGTSRPVEVDFSRFKQTPRVQASINANRGNIQRARRLNSARGFGDQFLFESLPDTLRNAPTAVPRTPGLQQAESAIQGRVARIKNPVGRTAANLGSAVLFETLDMPRKVLTGSLATGANLADLGFDKKVKKTKIISDAALLGEGLLEASLIGKAPAAARAAVAKGGIKKAAFQGAKSGAKLGGSFGALHSLGANRDAETVGEQLKDAAKAGAVGVAAGGLIGGVSAGSLAAFGEAKKAITRAQAKTLRSKGVVQAINEKTGEQMFFRVKKKEYDEIVRLIDNNRVGKDGVAGAEIGGFQFHITASTPARMKRAGFADGGIFRLSRAKKLAQHAQPIPATSAQAGFIKPDEFLPRKMRIKRAAKEAGLKVPKGISEEEALSQLPFGQQRDLPGGKEIKQQIDRSLSKTAQREAGELGTARLQQEAVESGSSTPIIPAGKKESGIAETVRTHYATPDELTESLAKDPIVRTPLSNKTVVDRVTKASKGKVENLLKIARDQSADGVDRNASVMLAIDKSLKKNDFESADAIIREFSDDFSKAGQEIQILSLYDRLTPTGALKYAKRVVDQANKHLPPKQQIAFKSETGKQVVEIAKKIQSLPEGSRERQVATAQLMQTVAEQVPQRFWGKVSTLQVYAQLLNPKTAIRNIVGNVGFAGIENVKDVGVATPLDILVSKFTGKRSKALPSATAQFQGAKSGLQRSIEDINLNIDTRPNIRSQFDLPRTQAFKGKVGTAAHKALRFELEAPDRAFYTAAYENAIKEQLKLAKINGVKNAKITPAMEEIAHGDALYRTFQDNSVAARLFSRLKHALNIGKDFGLGDLVLKYPKTPGNLLSRGIEYSPAGFFKSVSELVKPLITGLPFNQREFVEVTSRSLTGTGLIGAGALLHRLGIITGEPHKDFDLEGEEQERGFGQYRLNISALKRLFMSAFDADAAKPQDGDNIISYDWFQPQSVNLAIGADIDANEAKLEGIVGAVIEAIESGTTTLAEQPLVTGVRRLFGAQDPIRGLVQTAAGAPASFVPTLLNQITQLVDPKVRDFRSANPVKEAGLQVARKIPGVSLALAPRRSVSGEVIDRRDDIPNPLVRAVATFISPALISKFKADPVSDEIFRLFDTTGETSQARRKVPRTVQISKDGVSERIKLEASQLSDYQKYVGQRATLEFNKLVSDPSWEALPDTEKVKKMQSLLTDINTAAKIELFGHDPQRVDKGARAILLSSGSSAALGSPVSGANARLVSGSRFEQLKQEKAVYDDVAALLDGGLNDEQLSAGLQQLGVSQEDAQYYDVARQTNDLKTGYMQDFIEGYSGNRNEMISEMAELRRKVAGKHILANGVIEDLYDLGMITNAERKFLKSIDTGKDGKLKVSGGSGKKKKKGSVSPGSVPTVRVAGIPRSAQGSQARTRFGTVKIQLPKANTARLAAPATTPSIQQFKERIGA